MVSLNEVNTIIFDWDQTLVDSVGAAKQAAFDLRNKFSLEEMNFDLICSYGSFFKEILTGLHQKHIEELPTFEVFHKQCEDIIIARFSEVEFTKKQILKGLLGNGYKLAVVTGNSSIPVRNILKRSEVQLEVILGFNDLPLDQDKKNAIEKAVKLLGSKPQRSIYVGDSCKDVLAAKQSGVLSIAVATGVSDKIQLEESKPDLILDKLEDLLKYLS